MKRSFAVLVVAVVASMAMAGLALAEDHEEPTEATMVSPLITVDEEGKMLIALRVDADVPLDCESADEEAPDPDALDEVVEEGGEEVEEVEEVVAYGPGDCIELEVDHPSGKMHHGAITSTAAKGIHPSMLKESGLKKGHIMRCVAKLGKTNVGDCPVPEDLDVDDAGDDEDAEGEPEAKKDKPAKGNSENAKNKEKPNKGKKNR